MYEGRAAPIDARMSARHAGHNARNMLTRERNMAPKMALARDAVKRPCPNRVQTASLDRGLGARLDGGPADGRRAGPDGARQ